MDSTVKSVLNDGRVIHLPAQQDSSLFNPFERMEFTNDHCFLCGTRLQDDSTAEHIFPKWLQNKFKLWDRSIHLLNGTTIPYRNVKIPCCATCNNVHLSQLEIEIRNAFDGGYEEFKRLSPTRIFQWVSKIFYGLLFKELSLPLDIRSKEKGAILTPETLEQFRLVHVFLQSIRIPFDYQGDYPFSVQFVPTQATGNTFLDFDYADNFQLLTFSIRMGEVGIITSLQDAGADTFAHAEYYDRLQSFKLHPLQFREMVAKNTYSNKLMNRVPKFIITFPEGGDEITVITMPLGGMSGGPQFDDWDNAEYARFLQFYTSPYINANYTDLYIDGQVVSFLFDENNDFQDLPIGSKVIFQPLK